MNERQAVIYSNIIESCDAILAAIEDREITEALAALVMCVVVLAHQDNQSKQELIKRIEEGWPLFTRAHVEESIHRLNDHLLRNAGHGGVGVND